MSSESKRQFLKFPIDLRAHVLYDAYQRISIEKSYKNYEKLCEVLGEEAISFEEYESLFNQYLEEDERELPDIRGCILSDVINGKSAEKSIDDLCDAFKNHKIDKEDHAYWFKRFENGHLFSRVKFSDFPEDVISEIVDRCDIQSYFNLRNVSYGLRTIADQKAPLALFLTRPWFQVTTTEIPPRNYKDFFRILNSLDHKIYVEKCVMEVECEKEVVEALKCLKPGTLEKLEIDTGYLNGRINEVVKMDHWKLAKNLKIRTSELPPIENFYHFSTFELRDPPISMEDMVKLCKNLPKSNAFEHCNFRIQEKWETIKRVLNLQPTSTPQIYSIPNSNLVIQFSTDRYRTESFKIYKN